MRKMYKKISAFVFLMIYLLALCPAAVEADSVQIDATALTTIPAKSYIAESSTLVEADASDSSRIVISAGGSVSYNVTAPKDGYYKLLVFGKNGGSKPTVTVGGDAQNVTYGNGVHTTTDKRYTIARMYLESGERTITLTFSKKVNIKEILMKSVELDIAASGTNIIEAHDYLTSNIKAYDREDSQWNYKTTNTGVTVSGPVISLVIDAAKRICTYKVNVEQAGLYRLKAYSAFYKKNTTASFDVLVDGTQISKATYTTAASGIQVCQAINFETFNLASGEQELTIRFGVTGDGAQLYTYYYTLERIGDTVTNGEVTVDGENVLEGEELFYSDDGVEIENDAMKISNAVARADIDVSLPCLYAVTLRYKADADTTVYLRMGSVDETYQTLAKTEGEYVDFIYQITSLDSGLLRMLLNTEGTVCIDSITFSPIDESDAQNFIDDINAAKNDDELLSAFTSFENATGVDYANASQTIFYKVPLYERILKRDYENIEEFAKCFAEFVKIESLMRRLELNNGTKNIFALESGNIKMTLDTTYFAQNGATIVAAIYELDGDNPKRLHRVDITTYEGQPKIEFNFDKLVLDDKNSYSFKVIYFTDLDTVAPKEMFADVYKEIYVSKSGSDLSGDGSKSAPFESIEKAVEDAKTYSSSQSGDIIIKVGSGTYTLSDTLNFDETNSGRNGFSLVIEGDKENPPVISGGKEIVYWEPEGNGIYSAPVSGVDYVRNLYINGYPAVRARSEVRYEAGPIYHEEGSTYEKDGFSVSKDYVTERFDLEREDLELVWIYQNSNHWESRRTPVESIIETDTDLTFVLDRGVLNYIPSRFRNGDLFYFENGKELLDTPGEFYYNKFEGRIYYMPHEEEDFENAKTYIGTLEQMVNITGSSVDQKAENITFKNLIFRYGTYDFASKYGYDGQQADAFQSNYRGEDGSTQQLAQIYVENAEGIVIKDCEISCMGSAGIHFKEGVNDSLIEGNMIRDLSGTGVIIGHPDHKDKQQGVTVCNGVAVKNNVFRRNAAEYLNNTQITLYYEKNIDILHNDIDMAPYSGISASWGWESSNPYDCYNVDISYNRITNVMQLLNDGGAIYTVGKLKDSIISNNYINGSLGTVAGVMYQDSGSAYLEVFNNVILNATKSIYRNPNNDHDLNYYNNYSNIVRCDTSIVDKNITIETPIQVDADNLTGEAAAIANAAGVESTYSDLPAKDEFPAWRASRISLPPYIDNDKITVEASEFIPSESSSGLAIEKTYTSSIVTVEAGEYITFPIDIEKSGTYKVLIYGQRMSSSKPDISVADYTRVSSGLGVQKTDLRTYTIGRYVLPEGADKIKFSVSNAGGIDIHNIQLKIVDHEILPDVTNPVEIHDYYSANVTSYDHEDNQSGYESANCDLIVHGPVIASVSSARSLTYKMNVKEAGTYKMTVYYAGGAGAAFAVSADGVKLAEKSATGTGNSDPNKCNKVVIEGITLSSGDIMLGLDYAASGSGFIYGYYYELEKIN